MEGGRDLSLVGADRASHSGRDRRAQDSASGGALPLRKKKEITYRRQHCQKRGFRVVRGFRVLLSSK
jgi:hypothetical protein